jgi:ribosome-associated heat shock protein Hsp15
VGDHARQRIDKWLWFARIVKSRSLAYGLIEAGQVRVNGRKVTKPAQAVVPGNVITVAVHGRVRILKVMAFARHREAASIAQLLYETVAMTNSDRMVSQKEDATDAGTC